MTLLLDRFAATAEPEGDTVTQPYRPDARPFWLGIPGLDPAYPPPADPMLTARLAAEACANHVHGYTATMGGVVFGKSAAQKYLEWLLKAGGDDFEAWTRRYALRVTCDRVWRTEDIDPGDVLKAADLTVDFIFPGRRR
jgi:hypothetical protein